MKRTSESILTRLLPATVRYRDFKHYRPVGGSSIVQPPEVLTYVGWLEKEAKRLRLKRHTFYRLPKELVGKALCENNQHTLMSRLTSKGTGIEWFEGEKAMGIAEGPVPADYVYFDYPWPPVPGGPKLKAHFVCGFCAASYQENWDECRAEAAAS
jgi:hypothetical protein